MHFGKNLKFLIKKHGMTGGELADKLGVGQSAISSYVTGVAFPKVEALILMKKIFKTDIDTLLFNDLSIQMNNANELNEPQELYKKIETTEGVEYEVVKIYEPEIIKINVDTEGGVLENLLKRVEHLEKQVKELKQLNNKT